MHDGSHNGGIPISRPGCGAGADPAGTPAVLVAAHGPFVWGAEPQEAVENAIILEEIARMALQTLAINPKAERLPRALHDRHFSRKHGPSAYYGQKS